MADRLTSERRAELRVRAEFAKPVVGFGFVDMPSVTIYAADLLTLLDAADERDRLTTVAPCSETYTEPFDFAYCSTHDRTFALGDHCDYAGLSEVGYLEKQAREQRVRAMRAEDERARLAEVDSRLSVLLWRLTNGRLSKTSYPVEYMEQEIEECLARYHESDMRDERDQLAAAAERVRALHSPGIVFLHADECGHGDGDGHTVIEGLDGDLLCFDSPTDDRFCVECASAWDEPPAWPCPTLRALDGTDE